ncbi:hypothetical protein [Spiroplasma turonicum]|uniref:Lipoprotein n=1 Tax=Spiroplasma turonicum TaxID=216946 RepID=A0A0K1P698_9MOLU|nr:hypothetical protein [Spiroplasma turonicum]AKU79795.1 hypothetical protein STURON_00549 [Spiroplasma turonicum]ALX70813.1 hypothetical protein STURO_v1c05470 [Spiroplasma turonicum]
MKKFLSLLCSFGLLGTSISVSSNVISCGSKDNAKELTYQDNKKDSDVVSYLSNFENATIFTNEKEDFLPLSVVENKLGYEYTDTHSSAMGDQDLDFGTLEGSLINFTKGSDEEGKSTFGDFDSIFKELTDLKTTNTADGENSNITIHVGTLKGKKNEQSFTINIYKLSFTIDKDHNVVGDVLKDIIYKKNISLV